MVSDTARNESDYTLKKLNGYHKEVLEQIIKTLKSGLKLFYLRHLDFIVWYNIALVKYDGEDTAETGGPKRELATIATIKEVLDAIDTRMNEEVGEHAESASLVMPDNSRIVNLGRMVGWKSQDDFKPRAAVTETTLDHTIFAHGTMIPAGEVTVDRQFIVFQKGEGDNAILGIGVTSTARDWTPDHKHEAEVGELNRKGNKRSLLSETEAKALLTQVQGLESLETSPTTPPQPGQ